jgi:hypothetical protein
MSGINVFNSAVRQLRSSSQNLAAISQARQKLEQEKEDRDFRRRKEQIELEEAERSGKLSGMRYKFAESIFSDKNKQEKKIAEGQEELINREEEKQSILRDKSFELAKTAIKTDPTILQSLGFKPRVQPEQVQQPQEEQNPMDAALGRLNAKAPAGYEGNIDFLSDPNAKPFVRSVRNIEIPAGMEIVGYDQKGNPMIRKITRDVAGEKFDFQKMESAKTNEAKTQATIDAAQSAIDTIDTLLSTDKIKYFGAAGDVPPWPAEYSKKDWLTNFDFLSSKNIVNLISEMKSQSRTGATGFGQLNREELNVLRNASMKLKRGLREEDASKYLNEMRAAFQKIINREVNGYPGENTGIKSSVSERGDGWNQTSTGIKYRILK